MSTKAANLFIKNLNSKVLFCFLVFALPTLMSFSQNSKKEERQLLKKGRKALENEKYTEAQTNFSSLVKLVPNNDLYQFEAGLSYYFADVEREKCIPYFEAALQNSKEDTIPELYYYLARAYHFSGDYQKSEEAFQKLQPFIYKNTGAGKALLKQSDYYIQLNQNAAQLEQKKLTNVKILNLGESINSGYGEYAAVFGNVKDVILFTSRRPGSSSKTDKDLLPYEDVFVAQKTGDTWKLIADEDEIEKYIPKRLNTKGHDASIIYSADGTTLYTYKNDIIWKSILENGKWSDLVELDKNINNSQYNIPSICLSQDGKTIYFVSTKKDGKGGKDIYTSSMDQDGKWSPAFNLGDIINTEFDEDSPFITADGSTLYFSSKGHTGVGGYDIFKSKLVNGIWSTPENVGLPINSPVDDIYYIYDPAAKNGYFSSNRNGGIGGMDLYSFCFDCPDKVSHIINGLVADVNGNALESGKVNLTPSGKETLEATLQNGKYNITTENSGKHEMLITSENYNPQKISIELPQSGSTSSINFTLQLIEKDNKKYQVLSANSDELNIHTSDTVLVGDLMASNNQTDTASSANNSGSNEPSVSPKSETFFFGYNNNMINSTDSKLTTLLDDVANVLNAGGHVTIDIESSASKVPTNTYGNNSKLAKVRADEAQELISKILINKGVDRNKIQFGQIKTQVSGPAYQQDASNAAKYQDFQYVKISIR